MDILSETSHTLDSNSEELWILMPKKYINARLEKIVNIKTRLNIQTYSLRLRNSPEFLKILQDMLIVPLLEEDLSKHVEYINSTLMRSGSFRATSTIYSTSSPLPYVSPDKKSCNGKLNHRYYSTSTNMDTELVEKARDDLSKAIKNYDKDTQKGSSEEFKQVESAAVYENAKLQQKQISKENKGKAGIYL